MRPGPGFPERRIPVAVSFLKRLNDDFAPNDYGRHKANRIEEPTNSLSTFCLVRAQSRMRDPPELVRDYILSKAKYRHERLVDRYLGKRSNNAVNSLHLEMIKLPLVIDVMSRINRQLVGIFIKILPNLKRRKNSATLLPGSNLITTAAMRGPC